MESTFLIISLMGLTASTTVAREKRKKKKKAVRPISYPGTLRLYGKPKVFLENWVICVICHDS